MRAVNLIPADQRTGGSVGAGRSEGAAYAVLGLLAGLAVLALLYGIAHHQIGSRRGEVASLQARAQSKEAEANRLAPYTSFIALREERTKAVAQLVDSRFDWAHVFHEFGRVTPPFVSITSISGSVGSSSGSGKAGGPAAGASTSAASSTAGSGASGAGAGKGATSVTSATPPGTVPTFTVTGCALTQQLVALTLERLRLMDGVSNVTLQSSTKSASGGAGGSGGESCPPGAPIFSAQITFNPLPAATAPSSGGTAETTAATTGGAK